MQVSRPAKSEASNLCLYTLSICLVFYGDLYFNTPSTAMSTVPAVLDPTAPQSRFTAKADQEAARGRFEGAFGIVRDELFAHFAAHGLPADAVEWYSRVSNP